MTELTSQETTRRLEIIVDAASRSYDRAAQYDGAIVGLGFIGFFALWAGVSHDIPKWSALASAGLIGVSLISYVGWQIVTMFVRGIASLKTNDLIANGKIWEPDFAEKWDAAVRESQRGSARVLQLWKPTFYFSMATGLLGGCLLSAVAGTAAVSQLVAPSKSSLCAPTSSPQPPRGRPPVARAGKADQKIDVPDKTDLRGGTRTSARTT